VSVVSPTGASSDGAIESPLKVRVLLSIMMFFQYAVWGAWMAVFSGTLSARDMAGSIGPIFAGLWLACAITPFIGGQLADRIMPAQRVLAICHLLAAGVAFVVANQNSADGFLLWTFIWSLLFAPSLGITNAIALHHIDKLGLSAEQREREFALIRTAGTIGWIAAAFMLVGLFQVAGLDKEGKTGLVAEWLLAGGLGIVMSVLSLFLPNTPPNRTTNADPLAFREALGLFRTVPGFAVFMVISFIAATEFQFFYTLSAPFLADISIPLEWVGVVKTISQWAEIIALAVLLPLWLPILGMRTCLLIGAFAWPLRYFIFAAGEPVWLVVSSLALHGFGYAFVMVVQQLYVDRVAPKDIRASAQNLLNLITLGVGSFLGSLISGEVMKYFTKEGVEDWRMIFLIPAVLTTLCGIAYALTFRNPEAQGESVSGEPSPSLQPAER